MADAVGEEYKHFCMDLEFLLRRKPKWREIAEGVLFKQGDIVEHGEAAEAAAGSAASAEGSHSEGSHSEPESREVAGTLGIGSLKEGMNEPSTARARADYTGRLEDDRRGGPRAPATRARRPAAGRFLRTSRLGVFSYQPWACRGCRREPGEGRGGKSPRRPCTRRVARTIHRLSRGAQSGRPWRRGHRLRCA